MAKASGAFSLLALFLFQALSLVILAALAYIVIGHSLYRSWSSWILMYTTILTGFFSMYFAFNWQPPVRYIIVFGVAILAQLSFVLEVARDFDMRGLKETCLFAAGVAFLLLLHGRVQQFRRLEQEQ